MASILMHPGRHAGLPRTLSHRNDPKKHRGYASVSVQRGTETRSYAYAVVEPAHRSRKASELEKLFAADEGVKYESSFAHRFIKEDLLSSACQSEALPFYGAYHPCAFGRNRHGLTRTPQDARYCLVAQNGAGSAAGFIDYSVAVCEPADTTQPHASSSAALRVTLEGLYTRKRYRGKGAATALIRHLCDTVEVELRFLLEQPHVEPLTNLAVSVHTPERSASVTGQLAYMMVLDGVLTRLDAVQADYPQVRLGLSAPPEATSTDPLERNNALQTQANAA